MLRALFIALLLVCTPAHAQPAGDPSSPIARAAAKVIVQTLAPGDYGDWRYSWTAVSVRMTHLVHWNLHEPEPRDRPADALARRTGWIPAGNDVAGITVIGDDENIVLMTVDTNGFTVTDLIAALRAEGAAVSFQADYVSYSEYIVTPPARAPGLMTVRRVCLTEAAQTLGLCPTGVELTFVVE